MAVLTSGQEFSSSWACLLQDHIFRKAHHLTGRRRLACFKLASVARNLFFLPREMDVMAIIQLLCWACVSGTVACQG